MGSNGGTNRAGAGRGQPPAYLQLAEHLRERIVDGDFEPGDRLPGESDLGAEFDVSRSTVREAIRLLEAQKLVVTTRGTTGGSFVAEQSPDRIHDELGTSIDLLLTNDSLTVEQIIEARRLLEVPAVALAASRRTEDDLDALRGALDEGRSANQRFHELVLAASGNPLVAVMTAPLFHVIQARVRRDRGGADFWTRVEAEHRELLDHIEAGDGEAAAEAMERHLDALSAAYRLSDD
jgi:DNA-binding FadR family transcriptional regulator